MRLASDGEPRHLASEVYSNSEAAVIRNLLARAMRAPSTGGEVMCRFERAAVLRRCCGRLGNRTGMSCVRNAAIVGMSGLALGTHGFSATAKADVPSIRFEAHLRTSDVSKAPYTFTVFGRIAPPALLCPLGIVNPLYCELPPSNVCSGQVQASVGLAFDNELARSNEITNRFRADVPRSCDFSKQFTVPVGDLTAKTHLRRATVGRFDDVQVTVKYLGNAFLMPTDTKLVTIVAKLKNVALH